MQKHHLQEHSLFKKGWSEKEVHDVNQAFLRAEADDFTEWLDSAIYWFFLVAGLFGVVVFALYIIPLFFLFPDALLYPLVCLLGIIFGVLFSIIAHDMHWLTNKHHGLYLVALPLSVITVFTFIFNWALSYQKDLPSVLNNHHSVFGISLFFSLGLLLPYVLALITRQKRKASKNASLQK